MSTGIIPSQASESNLERLWHPAEAQAKVRSLTLPLPVESASLADAAWRYLAKDVEAAEDHPPFAAATMDGFAVVAEDASPWREVIADQPAGSVVELEVTAGTAVRIMTGAPIPRGADAVVPVEVTEAADDHVIIHQEQVNAGANIRPVGSDLRQGDPLLRVGQRLGPAELGLLAGQGLVPVPVRRRPRVSILSTGDELVDPGQSLKPGQIRDSNRFSLAAAVIEAGAVVTWLGKAPDNLNELRALLIERIADSDVVITSGGVSMGELDLIKPLLSELATVHFRRLFLKPGKPLNFATADETLIFGVPGNPVSALVAFELFIRPSLLMMVGAAQIDRPRVSVQLTEPATPGDRIEFQRATVYVDDSGRLRARATGRQQSSRLASFVGANALLIIAPRPEPYQSGEQAEALLFAPPESSAAGLPS
jgi:molybdenum cofactor synthesis domain-containing protein